MDKRYFLIILAIFLLLIAIIGHDFSTPTVKIPSINVSEEINNESIDKGVLLDPADSIPGKDPIILFGHRSLHGAPFLKLNELKKGDTIILEWADGKKYEYKVTDSKILPGDSELNITGNNIYLITCDPIGSKKNRLIVEGEIV